MIEIDNTLSLSRAGIDTYRQPVVFMREDCHVCRAEGFAALTRIEVTLGDRSVIATLNVLTEGDWLPEDTAALSEEAWSVLNPEPGDRASFTHPEPPASVSAIRAKVYGDALEQDQFDAIIRDVLDRRLSDLDLAAFITACAGDRLSIPETIALTRSMQAAGTTLDWGSTAIYDKHCVGGLPGNRTTPIVVSIVAAAGLMIPKTSSRAITSPAGTADTMEVMAPVSLDAATLRRVVEAECGCIAWGGNLALSPADDVLIRIERPLDFDSDGQLVASVLSKKAAVGAKRVLIDVPVGPTAKVRSAETARALEQRLCAVGDAIGLTLSIHQSDGTAPVGRGIGPALEAQDVLAVLRRDEGAPADLRDRALDLAGALLDLAPETREAGGRAAAARLLDSGRAEAKFMAICEAQGGFSEPGEARYHAVVTSRAAGRLAAMDNRRIARTAKLAGAPRQKLAGLRLLARVGDRIDIGRPLFEIHAETLGELEYARSYAEAQCGLCTIEEDRE
ncbi:thymidine phosphorylase family protein [Pseudodonghicola flavimaris]|uniref:Putative thymidine phosphorylase n=1 Tax=Pseudodonghicola flavimaris TaxID=3050036 RepID=A0ABT7F3C8_9RHOB|nr:thymidine phosphorylase family protein [Pseudodonghicola flavimaris]MDK3019120.1 thymidine phosphorylase family protein [Pseudodonghicola flavimaris]